MAYIGVSPSNGVRRKHTYTATANQTSFSGAGAEGATLSYNDSNFVDVYQNGVKLSEADYTSTSGTAIVLATGATVSDMIEVVVYDVFSVADTVSKSAGGTFDGNVTAAGTLTVTGNADLNGDIDVDGTTNLDVVDIDGTLNVAGETTLQTHLNMGDSDIIKLGDSADLQIHHSSSGYSSIVDSGTGHLFIGGSEVNLMNPALNEYLLRAITDSSVSLYHNNSVKLATSNTGVNVTGGIGLGGTGAANTLEDYEEGTWTPAYSGGGAAPTVGYSQQVGSYVKVGKFVFLSFSLNTSSVSGGASNSDLYVSGIPFACGSQTGDRGGLSTVRTQNWVSNARSPVAGYINEGSSLIQLSSYDTGAYSTATLCDTDDLRTTGDSNQLTATVTYISA